MARGKKDPEVSALEAVHAALKPLKPDARRKVLASVSALLQIAADASIVRSGERPTHMPPPRAEGTVSVSAPRPMSLVELVSEKRPGANPQLLALFAYYREKSEGSSRFSRDDLRPYFAKARIPPPANFSRDFSEAVKKGWIHEDGDESYLTSRGLEAVEAGFQGATKGEGTPRTARGQRAARKARARSK